MLQHFNNAGGSRSNREKILRRYGFGVPNEERALKSAANALTLIVQDRIRPFTRGQFDQMHTHQLPWPISTLEKLDEPLSDTDWLSGWYHMLDEQDLLVEVCFNAQMVIGAAVDAVNCCLPGPHLSRPARDVLAALDTMPLSLNERSQIEATLVSATSADVAMWRRAWESTRSEGRRSDCLAQTRDKATLYHAESMFFDARDMADTATEIIESRYGRTSSRPERPDARRGGP